MTTKITITLILLISTFVTQAQNIVIKAGHLFDARSGKMLDNQIIIIQNGRIKEVGANLKINKTDSIIDLSTSYVLPGLMDCHVHMTANEIYRHMAYEQTYINESTALRAIKGSVVAKEFLDNGSL